MTNDEWLLVKDLRKALGEPNCNPFSKHEDAISLITGHSLEIYPRAKRWFVRIAEEGRQWHVSTELVRAIVECVLTKLEQAFQADAIDKTLLCAKAMGLKVMKGGGSTEPYRAMFMDNSGIYDPLHNKEQSDAIKEKFKLDISWAIAGCFSSHIKRPKIATDPERRAEGWQVIDDLGENEAVVNWVVAAFQKGVLS